MIGESSIGDGRRIITHTNAWIEPFRTTAIYTANAGGDITEMSLLNLGSITPQKTTNKVLASFDICGEAGNYLQGFVLLRNGVALENATGDDRWEVTSMLAYEAAYASTPQSTSINFTDHSPLVVPSVYSLGLRSTLNAYANSFYLNRPVASTGASGQPNTCSESRITEYVT